MIYKSTLDIYRTIRRLPSPAYPPELLTARKNNYLAQVRALTEPRTAEEVYGELPAKYDALVEFDTQETTESYRKLQHTPKGSRWDAGHGEGPGPF